MRVGDLFSTELRQSTQKGTNDMNTDLGRTKLALVHILGIPNIDVLEQSRDLKNMDPWLVMFNGYWFYGGFNRTNELALYVRRDDGQPLRIESSKHYQQQVALCTLSMDPQWLRQNTVIRSLQTVFGWVFKLLPEPVRLFEKDLIGIWANVPIAWGGLLWHSHNPGDSPKVLTNDGFAKVVTCKRDLLHIWMQHGLMRASEVKRGEN